MLRDPEGQLAPPGLSENEREESQLQGGKGCYEPNCLSNRPSLPSLDISRSLCHHRHQWRWTNTTVSVIISMAINIIIEQQRTIIIIPRHRHHQHH